MKHPSRWFAPLYGLLVALIASVAWLGSHTASSASQGDVAAVVRKIDDVVTPGGKIYDANARSSAGTIGIILYCQNQDAIAAVDHHPTAAGCEGTPPKKP